MVMLAMLTRRAALVAIPRASRGLRAGKPAASNAKAEDLSTIIFKSDHTTAGMSLYHKLNIALIGLGPLALMLSPSQLNFPVDLAIGVIIPLHSHLGGNDVISDYARKVTKAPWFERALRQGVFGMTVVTFFGLLKLNLEGPGVTEAIKSLWRKKPSIEK
jgi:succinate dehydrogenase (ubiquinone) membrane anchor subunit